MSTCNCDGTISQGLTDLAASLFNFSDVAGGLSPDAAATIACQNAVARTRALGLDPCADDSVEVLANLFQDELGNVQSVTATVPFSNPLQRAVDVAAGTGTASTPVAGSQPPKPASTNWTFIIGAIVILALGFFLVIR
jgi:hypothetical protein